MRNPIFDTKIEKVTSTEQAVELHEYLSNIEDIGLLHLGEFLNMCIEGRSYIVRNGNDSIVAGLSMYETSRCVFVAYLHINKKNRNTRVFLNVFKLIGKYASDKKKNAYTILNGFDYSNCKFLSDTDVVNNGRKVSEILFNRIA